MAREWLIDPTYVRSYRPVCESYASRKWRVEDLHAVGEEKSGAAGNAATNNEGCTSVTEMQLLF